MNNHDDGGHQHSKLTNEQASQIEMFHLNHIQVTYTNFTKGKIFISK